MPTHQRILCVCLGNRSRSPMMQALLQEHLGDTYVVESAGVRREAAGLPANERSILVMRERGIDLNAHESRWAGDLALSEYSHVICVDNQIAERIRDWLPSDAPATVFVANGDLEGIPDPFEKGIEGYRECLALLDEIMPRVAQHIKQASPIRGA